MFIFNIFIVVSLALLLFSFPYLGTGGGGGGDRVVYRDKEVIKELIKYINLEEEDYKTKKEHVCKLFKMSRIDKCMLIGAKGSGKTSVLKYIFGKDTKPTHSVNDGTVEVEMRDEFLDTIGSEISLRSVSRLIMISLLKYRIFPKCFLVAKPDTRLYFAGLIELMYTGVLDVWVCPVNFEEFYRRVNVDKFLANRIYRWWYTQGPEKHLQLLQVFTEWYRSYGVVDKNDYKLYVNEFVRDHLTDHPYAHLLVQKEDLQCSETPLFERLKLHCNLEYKQYKDSLTSGDAVTLMYGHILHAFSPKYINMTSLTISEKVEKVFVNSGDEL